MKTLNEGISFLLDKYAVDKKVEVESLESVVIEGERHALLPWRWERRIVELKNLAQGTAASGKLEGISVMRVAHIDKKTSDLWSVLRRELDICEFVIGSEAAEIFAIQNLEKAMNVIMKLKNGVVCTIELATTLSEDAKVIDKHEIIAQKGVACDRVVDTQVPQSSIYLFTDDEKAEFQDVDAELYGLSIDEIAVVRQSFDMAANAYHLDSQAAHLDCLIAAAQQSEKELQNVIL